MTSTSVRELIVTGASGGVVMGATVEEVVAQLGEPTDRSQITAEILKYGRLELTFSERRVVLIAYYARPPGSCDPVDEDVPDDSREMEAWLTADGIAFERDEALSYDDQYALRATATGAVVVFERGRLRSVQIPG
jgi:hypothetical protein